MWLDVVVLVLALILLPLILFRTDKNGILFCKIAFVVVFLIVACEIFAIIIKAYTGDNMIFNIIMIPVQVMNLTSLSMTFYSYKEKEKMKKENRKNMKVEDIVV